MILSAVPRQGRGDNAGGRPGPYPAPNAQLLPNAHPGDAGAQLLPNAHPGMVPAMPLGMPLIDGRPSQMAGFVGNPWTVGSPPPAPLLQMIQQLLGNQSAAPPGYGTQHGQGQYMGSQRPMPMGRAY